MSMITSMKDIMVKLKCKQHTLLKIVPIIKKLTDDKKKIRNDVYCAKIPTFIKPYELSLGIVKKIAAITVDC